MIVEVFRGNVDSFCEWISAHPNAVSPKYTIYNSTYNWVFKAGINESDNSVKAGFQDVNSQTWQDSSGTGYGTNITLSDISEKRIFLDDDYLKMEYTFKADDTLTTRTDGITRKLHLSAYKDTEFCVKYNVPPLLKIDDVDLSEYCNRDNLTIQKSGVYSSGFTNLKGETLKAYLGEKYSISCSLTDIPNDLKERIDAACSSEKVKITFGDITATFSRPDTSFTLTYETTLGESMWSINISSVCELAPGGL